MSDIYPDLYLYNLTIQPSASAVKCCIGNFTGNRRQQEVVRATATSIELWKLNRNTGNFYKTLDQNTYSNIRTIVNFKTPGSTKDNLIITSDSGNLSVAEYNNETGRFDSVSNEPYFKTGLRRIAPGEYVALDGRSRAAMIGAIEKNKLVYTFKKDNNEKLLVSSPLEASRSKCLTFSLCGMDVGFENPLFAAIECNYSTSKTPGKTLCYYELDMGLNHVVRKYAEDIGSSASFLLPVPGGVDGPSGVLLCSEGLVQYKCMSKMTHTVPIPRRQGQQTAHSSIVTGVVHKLKNSFFILLQSDLGDLFKVTLEYDAQDSDESNGEPGAVNSIRIRYFDTMPVCNSLLIFKAGFLYASCESGDQYVYQFEKLGDDPDEKTFVSSNYPDEVSVLSDAEAFFEPRAFANLNLVNITENVNPLVDARLHDPGDASSLPSVHLLSGTGARSSLGIYNRELPFSEIVTQELPSAVQKVFVTRLTRADAYDRYVVLSFVDATLVLGIGEEVEEVENSGFVTDAETLAVVQVGAASVVQVHGGGLRQIFFRNDAPERTVEWAPPAGIKVLHAAGTNTQVVLALSNREVVYFEIDELDRLIEYSEHIELAAQVTALSLGELQPDRARFPFILAGCQDSTLAVLSTSPENTLGLISQEPLSSVASSLDAFFMCDRASGGENEDDEDEESEENAQFSTSSLFVHIGMRSGVYAKLQMDPNTGDLSNPRNKYTGPREVAVCRLRVAGQNVVMVCSTRTYLGYMSRRAEFKVTPLSKPVFHFACPFQSEDVPKNGVIAVHGSNLTIMTVDQLENDTVIESIGLRYTPKGMADCSEQNGMVYVVESDYGIKSPYNGDEGQDEEELVEYCQQFGYERVSDGVSWGSCIQTVSLAERSVAQSIELSHEEAAFRACHVTFRSGQYVVVSTAREQRMEPPIGNSGSFLRVYKVSGTDGTLEFVHSTRTESVCLCVLPFQDRLLVGTKNQLILYDLGQKQLLKKASVRLSCQEIVDIRTQGFRLVVSDVRNGVCFVVYKPQENMFVEFASDTVARHVTKTAMLDYDTVIGGDKFGNVFVLRCPSQVSTMSDEDSHGTLVAGQEGKLVLEMSMFLGDIPTSFQRGSLTIGGTECVLYTCLQGLIGCLHPLRTLSEINFFRELQKLVAEEIEVLTERDFFKFRGYYAPIKGCIDGDLVEEYYRLSGEKRLEIARRMERLPREVDRRISEMRGRVDY